MRSSRDAGRRSGAAGLALLAAAIVALLAGCAAPARLGEPQRNSTEAPAPEAPAAPAPAAAPRGDSGSAGHLDPSEQITPDELASIPDPAPAGAPAPAPASQGAPEANEGLKGSMPQPMDSVAPGGPEAPPRPSGNGVSAADSAFVWRVQIFASESRAEAERVAREAGARLDAPADVARDGSLFKVRLGRFSTEAEAQALRERARQAGYGGAFRIRTP